MGGRVRRPLLEIPGIFVTWFTGFSGARAEEVAGLPGSWDSSHATALESSWSCRQHQEAPRLIKLSLDGSFDGMLHQANGHFSAFSPGKVT